MITDTTYPIIQAENFLHLIDLLVKISYNTKKKQGYSKPCSFKYLKSFIHVRLEMLSSV